MPTLPLPSPRRLLRACVLAAACGAAAAVEAAGECANTVWGRHFLADDRGDVCRWGEVGTGGCCGAAAMDGSPHSCATCDTRTRCCATYEYCVACCLRPEHAPDAARAASPRGREKPETGYFETSFGFCRSKCRTQAKVTVHENAYISPKHYCFGSIAPTPEAATDGGETQAGKLPAHSAVVAAARGVSCDKTCSGLKPAAGAGAAAAGAAAGAMTCRADWLAVVNTCDTMRAHFACEAGWLIANIHSTVSDSPPSSPRVCMSNNTQGKRCSDLGRVIFQRPSCEAGCDVSAGVQGVGGVGGGNDHPAYVAADAAAEMMPRKCLVSDAATARLSCQAGASTPPHLTST